MSRSPSSHALPAVAALYSLLVFGLSASALPAALLRAAGEFGITFAELAQVSAVQFLGFVLAAAIGGALSDVVGRKHVMQAACLLLIGGALIWTAAPGRRAAFAGGALMGVGGGILESLGSSLLSDLFPARRKFFLNLSQVLYCAGAVTGPALMGWLLPRGVSWRWFFAGIGVAGAGLLAVYSASRLPRPAHDERLHWGAVRRIAGRASFWIPCGVLFAYVLSESCVVVFVNAYLHTVLGAPESWAIYAISLFWVAMGIGRWLCAIVPERISYRKLIASLCVLTAAFLTLQQAAPHWAASLVLFTLTGLAFSGIWPLVVGMTATWNRGYTGTVLGTTIAIGALGCVAAPPLMDLLFRRLPPETVFPVAALPLVLSSALLVAARRDPWRHCHPGKKTSDRLSL